MADCLTIEKLQKGCSPFCLEKSLILHKILPVFFPSFGKRFEFFARIVWAIMTMGDTMIQTTKMKSFTAFTPRAIDVSSRTGISVAHVGRTPATENATSWNSSLVMLQCVH